MAVAQSRALGHNPLSDYKGSVIGHGPTNHADVLLKGGAGGRWRVTGDFLFRDQASFYFDGGIWGILRVGAGSGNGADADNTVGPPSPFSGFETGECYVDASSGQAYCIDSVS